jgi:cytoskeletal protein CcmA (bactofilin family)
MPRILVAALIAYSGLALAAAAPKAEHGPAVREAGSDRFVAGKSAIVSEPVAGDLFVAGGDLDIGAKVGGDLVAAGGRVRVDGDTGNDLYAIGGRVSLQGSVAHNLRIAGASVQIGSRARVSGGASVAGGEVNVLGAVDGYLQAAGGRVFIDGTVGGDVDVAADAVELGPGARIGGGLRYVSRKEIVLDPGAQVKGPIERRLAPLPRHRVARAVHALRWVWNVGLIVLAGVLVAVMPRFFGSVAEAARRKFWWSLLLGFALLVSVPCAAVLLLATGIGAPLALLLVALYLALLLVGYVSAGIALGRAGLQRWHGERTQSRSWGASAAVLGMLVIVLLGWVPVLGFLVRFVALITGTGAVGLQAKRADAPAAA